MGFFSGLAGAALSIGSSLLGHRNETAQQQRNISWEKEQLQNKHQWEVEDLKASGLNPILSANSAAGGAASAAQSSASQADIARSIKELALLDAEIDNYNADSALKIANGNLANEQAKTQPFTRQNLAASTSRDIQQALTFGSQARNLNANSARQEMENSVFSASPELMRAKVRGDSTGKAGGALSIVGDTLEQSFKDIGKWLDSLVFNSGRSLYEAPKPSSNGGSAKSITDFFASDN